MRTLSSLSDLAVIRERVEEAAARKPPAPPPEEPPVRGATPADPYGGSDAVAAIFEAAEAPRQVPAVPPRQRHGAKAAAQPRPEPAPKAEKPKPEPKAAAPKRHGQPLQRFGQGKPRDGQGQGRAPSPRPPAPARGLSQRPQEPRQEPRQPPAQQVRPAPGYAARASGGPSLTLPTGSSLRESVTRLMDVAGLVCSVRGLPNATDLARAAIEAFSHDKIQSDRLGRGMTPKIPLIVIADFLKFHFIGAGPTENLRGTRGFKVAKLMESVPTPMGAGFAQVVEVASGLDVIEVPDVRDASSALDVFRARFPDFNYDRLRELENCKVIPEESVREPSIARTRRVLPDFGSLLALAALEAAGFEVDGYELPVADPLCTNFVALAWMENALSDLKSVLADNSPELRGEAFSPFLSGPGGEGRYTPDLFQALRDELAPATVRDGARSDERRAAERAYAASPAKYDTLRAEWDRIQREADPFQERAVLDCEIVLALIRFKRQYKTWLRDREQEASRAGGTPRQARPARTESTAAPDRAALEGDQELFEGMGIPRFNAEALQLSEVARRKSLQAAGLDGPRRCAAYPGVVWEAVIGPMHHALDPLKHEDDCTMVVIAPRAVGGSGLVLAEARPLLVAEYEAYFEPFEEGAA